MPTSWWSRAIATIIDTAIVWVTPVLLVAVGRKTEDELLGTLVAIAYVLALLGVLLYAPLLTARPGTANGQTLGKQALGMRIVRDDGRPLDFRRACLREIVGKLLLGAVTTGLWTLVDDLWPLADGRRQALHDKMASTVVVRED